MYSQITEITEENNVGVGGLPVHADAADCVLVHRGRVVLRTPIARNLICCCCLPCNHCSNWTWVVEEILAFGTRLRSTHCREFNYLKLCRPAYFVRTTQLLPHPGHE